MKRVAVFLVVLMLLSTAVLVCSASGEVLDGELQIYKEDSGRYVIKNPEIINGVLTIPYLGDSISVEFSKDTHIDTLILEEGIKHFIYFMGNVSVSVDKVYLPASYIDVSEMMGWYAKYGYYYVDKGNEKYSSKDGVIYSRDGKTLIMYGAGRKDKSFCVPEGVEVIADASFNDCENLEKVVLSESVKRIEDDVFNNCIKLREINVGENIEYFSTSGMENTIWYAEKKAQFEKFGEDVIIGDGILIFSNGEGNYVVPENVKMIGNSVFKNKEFETIYIPGNVKYIGREAFRGCFAKRIIMNEGIEEIGRHAFADINKSKYRLNYTWIENVVLPNSLKMIDNNAFKDSNIEEIYFSEGFGPENFKTGRYVGASAMYIRGWIGKFYIKRDSSLHHWMSQVGFLVFDRETGNAMLPEYCGRNRKENGDKAFWIGLLHDKDSTKPSIDAKDMMFPDDERPFIKGRRVYVPLRYMCERFNIPLYWNSELMIAEVGTRGDIEPNRECTALFGNENLVRYDGKILEPLTCEELQRDMNTSLEIKSHSAINIDGKLYVPILDLARSGLLKGYSASLTDAWGSIIELDS